jgi:hypothetical protein
MEVRLRIPLTNIIIGRFGFLLISILLMFTIRPFLVGYVSLKILMDIFISAIVVAVIYAVSEQKRVLVIALAIAIPTLFLTWSNYFINLAAIRLVSDGISAVFTVYATISVLSYVFREKKITVDVIFAAISGFFLIGLMWAFVYSALEFILPGSFQYPQVEGDRLSHATYYSFVTLTTLGYGDITPVSAPARSFSLLEAVTGQLYIAILIAGLVGKYIAQSLEQKS